MPDSAFPTARPATTTVADDHPCASCGYNLRGLTAGTAIERVRVYFPVGRLCVRHRARVACLFRLVYPDAVQLQEGLHRRGAACSSHRRPAVADCVVERIGSLE